MSERGPIMRPLSPTCGGNRVQQDASPLWAKLQNDGVTIRDPMGREQHPTINNEPWFVGKDVAQVLGYEAPKNAIPTHVDEDDRILVNAETQHRFSAEFDYKALGQRGGWLINESGLYSLILSSKLPGASQEVAMMEP